MALNEQWFPNAKGSGENINKIKYQIIVVQLT